MINQEESVLTIQDVCDALKVGRNRVYKMLASRELKGWRIGHTWKITQSSLQEYLATCGYTYKKKLMTYREVHC